MDTTMPKVRREMYEGPRGLLTQGEASIYRDLLLIAEMSPYELEYALHRAAVLSPRRDYWRMAAMIHVCKRENTQQKRFILPPMALSLPSYEHRLIMAWRIVAHCYAVGFKTGLIKRAKKPS